MRRSATSGRERRRQREEEETEGQRDGEMKRQGGRRSSTRGQARHATTQQRCYRGHACAR